MPVDMSLLEEAVLETEDWNREDPSPWWLLWVAPTCPPPTCPPPLRLLISVELSRSSERRDRPWWVGGDWTSLLVRD